MSENIQSKKNIQLIHLNNSIQTHKHQYLRRPLSNSNTPVYLNSMQYLSQLMPTFLSHYHLILKQEEVSALTNDLMLLNQDLLAKLKNTADKLQAKSTEVITFKAKEHESYDSLAMSQRPTTTEIKNSIPSNLIHRKEQTDTFTPQEDKKFYQQLKAALQRKEQVLAICHTESLQYASFLQEQVHDLLTMKEGLFQKEEKEGETTNGEELKRDVSKSLQEQWKLKIPNITKTLTHKILKQIQQNRRLLSRNVEIQTDDINNAKITELKRKITQLQKLLSDSKSQRQRLQTSCDQKQLLIKRLEAELDQSREEYYRKQYDMQKSIRNLEESSRKIKEEFTKEKSRKAVTEKEVLDLQIKSIKTIQQLQEQPQAKVQKQEELAQQEERMQKKKKTLINIAASHKFILPTLNKASSKENIHSKTEYQDGNMQNFTSRTQKKSQTIKLEAQNQSVGKTLKEKVTFQTKNKKSSLPAKDAKKQKENNPNQISQNHKNVQAEKEKKTQTGARKITKNANSNQKKNSLSKNENNKNAKRDEIRFPSINKDDPKDVKAPTSALAQNEGNYEITGFNTRDSEQQNQEASTMKSIVSLLGNNKNKKETDADGETLLKANPNSNEAKKEKSPYMRNQGAYNRTQKKNTQFQAGQKVDRNNPSAEHRREMLNTKSTEENESSFAKKTYLLSTPFERINEDIEKQNYVTPMLGVESPGLALKREMDQKARRGNKANLKQYLVRVLDALRNKEEESIDLFNLKNILEEWQKEEESLAASQKCMENDAATDNASLCEKVLQVKGEIQGLKVNQVQTLKSKNYNGFHKELRKILTEGQDQTFPKKMAFLKSQMHTPVNRSEFAKERVSCPIPQKKPDSSNLSQCTPEAPFIYTKGLFLNEEMAYKYETGFGKKLSKRSRKLSEQAERAGDQLFGVLQKLKIVDKIKYQKVCKQLRYPFSSSGQRNYLQIEIVNSMSAAVVRQCIQIVAILHQKCRPQTILCSHIEHFTEKLESELKASYENYY